MLQLSPVRSLEIILPSRVKNFQFKRKQLKREAVNLHMNSTCFDSLLYEQNELLLNQIAYFDKTSVNVGKGVKGNVCKHIKFWESIGANQFVLDTIREVPVR